MAELSSIEWTDHTFNPWWGCTKVSQGCKNCYADTLSTRYGRDLWGPQAGRGMTSPNAWEQPIKWNQLAECVGVRARVFCASMADVFEDWMGQPHVMAGAWQGSPIWVTPDDEAHVQGVLVSHHRNDLRAATLGDLRRWLFRMIEATPCLDWQLLTKRPENVTRMVPESWLKAWPTNAWIGTSVEDQEQADKRIPELLEIPAFTRFLSCEPLIGPVDLAYTCFNGADPFGSMPGIHWVIAGGELLHN